MLSVPARDCVLRAFGPFRSTRMLVCVCLLLGCWASTEDGDGGGWAGVAGLDVRSVTAARGAVRVGAMHAWIFLACSFVFVPASDVPQDARKGHATYDSCRHMRVHLNERSNAQ